MMRGDEVNIMARLVLEALANNEEPRARLHTSPPAIVMQLVFNRLRDAGFLSFKTINDPGFNYNVALVVTNAGREFLKTTPPPEAT